MNKIVFLMGNNVFTDSMVIAKGTRNQHKSVVSLIKAQNKRLEKFGSIEFSDLKSRNPKGGRPTRIYKLNEMQATLLITFLDNTEIVADFKVELVRQFYQMRRYIMEHQSPHWQQTRLESRINRRIETDEIKEFVEYAKAHGSKNADRYYVNFTNLANKAVGIDSNSRDSITAGELNNLILIEHIIGQVIRNGIQREVQYKEIYQDCKRRIGQFREITYLQNAG